MITYKYDKSIHSDDLQDLYADVGWTAYTKDMLQTQRGIAKSWLVISAWDDEEVLLGLVRVISDGETIAYIQDILVKKAYQKQGIGKKLMELVFEKVQDIRQVVLITDGSDWNKETLIFYEKVGLKAFENFEIQGFARFLPPTEA